MKTTITSPSSSKCENHKMYTSVWWGQETVT